MGVAFAPPSLTAPASNALRYRIHHMPCMFLSSRIDRYRLGYEL